MGEVVSSLDARAYFSTDASIFKIMPAVIVYPRGEGDVRKVARFTWQLAERGRLLPITARGGGSDQTGAAIGGGVILVFPAHMNRILELDSKTGIITVEPGLNFGKLQQTLHTHGKFLPPAPVSLEYSTIGGAIANNAGGEKSLKYGTTRKYVKSLRVVLANGEIIQTERLSKRELNKKLGLSTFEGEVYRGIDGLLEENHELLKKLNIAVSKNTAGYELTDIKHKDGSFDLTPLFVGSQGTLGIITEAMLDTETHNPESTLLVGYFDKLQNAVQAVMELKKLSEIPSVIELVDENLLKLVSKLNPNQLKDVIDNPVPKAVLMVEFDNGSDRTQKRMTKKAKKILEKYGSKHVIETDPSQQDKFWRIRSAPATIMTHSEGGLKAVPVVDDGVVPVEKLEDLMKGIYDIFYRNHLSVAVWGHAGDGNLHLRPFLDLEQLGDRQKAFRLMDEYTKLLADLGGSTSGEMGDGRLRGPYLERLYGNEIYTLFQKVKLIFDPHGTLNPGVKVNVTVDDTKPLLRQEYTLYHMYQHLPHG
ncbi:MAG TPA: FAD-binding oxidoreductase [Candidatus Saccharimonadales bacterium]|nr:FAD-binding oxidoreductase [Candidatus Saccharimonadales bacterium]